MQHHAALRQISPGKRVRVHGISADSGLIGHLCALGLTPGTLVDVCSQGAACCVRVRDASIVLNDRMAEHILCAPLEDGPAECRPPACREEETHEETHHGQECICRRRGQGRRAG